MQIYMVGGAVRDRLLGLPVKDRDWVVVGATPEQMVEQGFLPVGRDFPVFLHPQTREEYALARTERKTARGYRGFAIHAAPEVTLEQDLARRDLTINAIAISAHLSGHDGRFDVELDHLVDPYHGQRDLQAKVLRHVTDAFREDPVRILRVARLCARFTDFHVATQTQQLMHDMVEHGEVDHLVAERVWQELARGLMEAKPSRMFEQLRACGALKRLLPEVDCLWGVPQRADCHPEIDTGVHLMMVLDVAAHLQVPLAVRLACLTHDLGKGTEKLGSDSKFISVPSTEPSAHEHVPMKLESGPNFSSARLLKGLCERVRVPTDCRELAEVVAREHSHIHRSADLNAAAIVRLLERCDAIRQPQRFAQVLLACECVARGRLGVHDEPYPQPARLAACLRAAQSLATAEMAGQAHARGVPGPQIGALIHAARVGAVEQALSQAMAAPK